MEELLEYYNEVTLLDIDDTMAVLRDHSEMHNRAVWSGLSGRTTLHPPSPP